MDEHISPDRPSDLLGDAHTELDAIRTASGLTDAQFRALCLPVLRHYAATVQTLPLSRTDFAEREGAWKFGLEAAMVAYRVAGTVIFFPEMGSETRRLVEPQCRFMAYFATLASGICITFSNVAVRDGEDEFHPLIAGQSLFEWLQAHPQAALAWLPPSTASGAQCDGAITHAALPTELLKGFDLRCVQMMYNAVFARDSIQKVEATLTRVVRESISKVREHRRSTDANRYHSPDRASSIPEILHTPPPSGIGQNNAVSKPAAPPAAAHDPGAINPVLLEWLTALKSQSQYRSLRNNTNISDEGIEVPISMLGLFGISGTSIRAMLAEAGLILRRTESAREVVLVPSLACYFPAVQEQN
jgi:hypothetical protein